MTPSLGLMCFPAWCQASLGHRWIPLQAVCAARTPDTGGSALVGYRRTTRIGQAGGPTVGSHSPRRPCRWRRVVARARGARRQRHYRLAGPRSHRCCAGTSSWCVTADHNTRCVMVPVMAWNTGACPRCSLSLPSAVVLLQSTLAPARTGMGRKNEAFRCSA